MQQLQRKETCAVLSSTISLKKTHSNEKVSKVIKHFLFACKPHLDWAHHLMCLKKPWNGNAGRRLENSKTNPCRGEERNDRWETAFDKWGGKKGVVCVLTCSWIKMFRHLIFVSVFGVFWETRDKVDHSCLTHFSTSVLSKLFWGEKIVS